MMRITQVVASLSDGSAGPTYSVSALSRSLTQAGAGVQIRSVRYWRDASLGAHATMSALAECVADACEPSMRHVPFVSALCMSSELRAKLAVDALAVDVLHSHGLWLMPNVYPAWAVGGPQARAHLVVSPRGMLSAAALAYSPWKKRLFWLALQKRALDAASCLHATSEEEGEDFRRAGLRNPIAVIPNGVDIPPLSSVQDHRAGQGGIVLSLGRIHPKKGLDRLVAAWSLVEAQRPDWTLRIIGPAEVQHDRELRKQAQSLGLERVFIEPPLFGTQRTEVLRQADVFVLPTRNENFAMTVAEALAAGTPVISTKGAPWSGLEVEGCGWWVDHGPEPLARALNQAMDLPSSQREAMGARGRDWMARDFSWRKVAADMLDVYRWVSVGGDRPSTVRLN